MDQIYCCNTRFYQWKKYLTHLNGYHFYKTSEIYKCVEPECLLKFSNKKNYLDHFRLIHRIIFQELSRNSTLPEIREQQMDINFDDYSNQMDFDDGYDQNGNSNEFEFINAMQYSDQNNISDDDDDDFDNNDNYTHETTENDSIEINLDNLNDEFSDQNAEKMCAKFLNNLRNLTPVADTHLRLLVSETINFIYKKIVPANNINSHLEIFKKVSSSEYLQNKHVDNMGFQRINFKIAVNDERRILNREIIYFPIINFAKKLFQFQNTRDEIEKDLEDISVRNYE